MASIFDNIRNGGATPLYKYLVNGDWRNSSTERTISIYSPTDGSEVGRTQAISLEEADEVIRNAKAAFPGWAGTPAWKRAQLLHKGAALIKEHSQELANLLVKEIGKPRKLAQDEVDRTVELIDYYAEEGLRLLGELVPGDSWPGFKRSKLALVDRVPIGVVLAIPPFNYPVNEAAPKLVAALMAGNSVVLKPPTQGAISCLYLAQCLVAAGLPPGALNIATGRGSEIGDFLLSHSDVACVNFTGGSGTGEHIMRVAGFKKLVMGLSGKDAAIVCGDADLELAAGEIASGSFSYAAQRCTAIKRVLVEEKVAEPFLERFRETVTKSFVLGDPDDPKVTLGPVISDAVADYVQELIDDAVGKGARVAFGNRRRGRYIEATALDRVNEGMRIAWEEPFGPVLPIMEVRNWQEAVALANKSEYGLQSSVFTKDLDKAFAIAHQLEVGAVQINAKDSRGPDHFPFLGVKQSGLGMVQGAKYLLQEMTRLKTTVLNLRS